MNSWPDMTPLMLHILDFQVLEMKGNGVIILFQFIMDVLFETVQFQSRYSGLCVIPDW